MRATCKAQAKLMTSGEAGMGDGRRGWGTGDGGMPACPCPEPPALIFLVLPDASFAASPENLHSEAHYQSPRFNAHSISAASFPSFP
jgi:hypothetical protein